MSRHKPEVFDFIVNRRGGTVMRNGEEKIREEIVSHFGARTGSFTFVAGDEVKEAVRAWVRDNAGSNRCLVIGGGDGTVMSAVEEAMGRDDVMLGILPLGTQNFVARQLGFAADFKKAAAQYKGGHGATMDVGEVNGLHFLVGMTLDDNSLNYFRAREKMRDDEKMSALRKAFTAAAGVLGRNSNTFTVYSEEHKQGKKIEGRIVAITNNSVDPVPVHPLPYNIRSYRDALMQVMGRRKRAGKLSLYVFKGGLIGAPAMLPDVLRGTWDKNPAIEKETAKEFVVAASENGHQGDVAEKSIVLDGEIKKVQYPLKVRILRHAVRVFKPK